MSKFLIPRGSVRRLNREYLVEYDHGCNVRGYIQDCIEYHGLAACHIFNKPSEISHDMLLAYLHGIIEFPDHSIRMECTIHYSNRFFPAFCFDGYDKKRTRLVYKMDISDNDPYLSVITSDQIRFKRIKTRLHGFGF